MEPISCLIDVGGAEASKSYFSPIASFGRARLELTGLRSRNRRARFRLSTSPSRARAAAG
jgi:hypothetical protein